MSMFGAVKGLHPTLQRAAVRFVGLLPARRACRGQDGTLRTPVMRIGGAPDKSCLFQLVDDAGNGAAREEQTFAAGRQAASLALIQQHQYGVLRSGQSK